MLLESSVKGAPRDGLVTQLEGMHAIGHVGDSGNSGTAQKYVQCTVICMRDVCKGDGTGAPEAAIRRIDELTPRRRARWLA